MFHHLTFDMSVFLQLSLRFIVPDFEGEHPVHFDINITALACHFFCSQTRERDLLGDHGCDGYGMVLCQG